MLVARQTAVDRLTQQRDHLVLHVPASSGVTKMGQRRESQHPVQLPAGQEACTRGDSRPLELQPQSPVESKLQRFLGLFTRWVPQVTVLRLTYREQLLKLFSVSALLISWLDMGNPG